MFKKRTSSKKPPFPCVQNIEGIEWQFRWASVEREGLLHKSCPLNNHGSDCILMIAIDESRLLREQKFRKKLRKEIKLVQPIIWASNFPPHKKGQVIIINYVIGVRRQPSQNSYKFPSLRLN